MNIRIAASAAAVLAAIGLIAFVAFGTTGNGDINDVSMPTKLNQRLETHPGERARVVDYGNDDVRTHALATHWDESTTEYFYWPVTGNAKHIITSTPADEEGNRKVLREALVEADGVTYTSDIEYYLDGSKKKVLLLTEPNKSTRQLFYPSGVLSRDEVMTREKPQGKWTLVSADTFRQDSSIETSFRLRQHNASEFTEFSPEGVAVVRKTVSQYKTSYNEVWFAEDGKTLERQVDQNSSVTKVTYFHANGVKWYELEWHGEVGKGTLHVFFYDERGNKLFQQWWDFKDGEHKLWLIKEFRTDGSMSRMFYWEPAGGVMRSEVVYHGDGNLGGGGARTLRKFRDNGTLELEDETLAGNVNGPKRSFSAEENIRYVLDPARTKMPEVILPPQVVPYSPPMMGH